MNFSGVFAHLTLRNFFNGHKLRWIIHLEAVLGDYEGRLSEEGRYNAGQKIIFWSMTMMIAVQFVSKLAVWEIYFAPYTDTELARAAAAVRAAAARNGREQKKVKKSRVRRAA